nr:3-oxoacyl-[acyl-carrier-protein] reductase [Calderihabitans maritimus]
MLDNRVAIVTGASRGIGRATALALASAGASVVVNYFGSEEAAREVVSCIEAKGGRALALQADVANGEAVAKLVESTLDHFGRVDILVNNAGITRDNLLLRMKEDDWDKVINTNLKGVYNCTKAVLKPMMKQKEGRIINIASVVGISGNAGQANYAAAKAGIIGFTKSVAKEVASRGILVNAVAPGFIITDMTDSLSEKAKAELQEKIPLGRLGKPEDVAQVVLFLASPAAGYITGQVINVDGGMLI